MILPDERIIPSLMFHSIGLEQTGWVWAKLLSEPMALFESKLALLRARGFSTVFWDDVHSHVSGKRLLDKRTIMLTFDDGYLDNWVLLWPLLKRYEMKATVFVSADFIEPDGPPRLTLEDVWSGRAQHEDLQLSGFLRPSEIRRMSESGLVDFQSHATTHTWWYSGNRMEAVYTPEKYQIYPWLAWNARPDRKPFYLGENQAGFVTSGEPVFQHAKAIVARRFFPAADAVGEFRDKVSRAVSGALNPHTSWERAARTVLEAMNLEAGWPGIHETVEEREMRIRGELLESRRVLSGITGKDVEFVSWPGGGYDPLAIQVAEQSGFRAYTLGSRDQQSKRNQPGQDPFSLKRIGTENQLIVRGVDCGTKGALYQYLRVRAHQHSRLFELMTLLYKSIALGGALTRRITQ